MYRDKAAMKDIWRQMNFRCYSPKHPQYADYGGKGITVCDEWRESFDAFYRDMAPSPKELTLDRIDNAKGYYKENCRWLSRKEQNRNRTITRNFTHNGKTMMLCEWADELGMNRGTLHYRIFKIGMSFIDAITIPVTRRTRVANLPLTSELRPSNKPKRKPNGYKNMPAANSEHADKVA